MRDIHLLYFDAVTDLVKQAKQAEAQGQTSPQGASDASATTAAGINLPTALTMEAPGPTSAVTKAEDEPGGLTRGQLCHVNLYSMIQKQKCLMHGVTL